MAFAQDQGIRGLASMVAILSIRLVGCRVGLGRDGPKINVEPPLHRLAPPAVSLTLLYPHPQSVLHPC